MSITAHFYTFTKKKNSTKRPSGGTSISVVIKDPSSATSPRLELDISNPTAYNYVHIPAFGNRYYFITDWISDHNRWICDCTVDVLATYRSDILTSYQYVLRSASERNPYIADSSYPMDTSTVIARIGVGTTGGPNPFFGLNRCYVLAISNGNTTPQINGVQYLVCNYDQLREIMYGTLNGNSDYWDPGASSGVSDSIFRSIVNPLQYFGEAYLLPIDVTSSQLSNVLSNVTNNQLKVGSWTVPYSGSQLRAFNQDALGGYVYTHSVDVDLPFHPQRSDHGEWVTASPYSRYYLYAGIYGLIQLDTSYITQIGLGIDHFTVTLTVNVDFKGNTALTVTAASGDYTGAILAKSYASAAVPISLTQTKNNTLGWISQGAGVVGAAMSGNIPGVISGTAGLISGTESLMNKPETKGIQGATACVYEPWYIQAEFHNVVCRDSELPMNIIGYPLCETKLLSELTGFCQTSEPWLDLDCYASEYDAIMGLMTDGFYIET